MSRGDYLQEFELHVLLAVITLGDEAYGAAIQRELDERIGRSVAIGSIYSTLGRLLDKGLVSRSESEPLPVRGGRARKCYRLTPRGQREVRRSVDALGAMMAAADVGPGSSS